MALFVISIPLMLVAVGVAVVPLVVVSRREVTELVHEAEMKFERHRRNHPVRHRAPLERGRTVTATSRRPHSHDSHESHESHEHHEPRPLQRPWHEPVLLEQR